MQLNSRRSSVSNTGSNQQSAISNQLKNAAQRVGLVAGCWLLVAALTGCESLQRKFTRKPQQPRAAPSPITIFQDYSSARTPADRYRKHYLIFDYWQDELLEALQSPPVNPKRYKRASGESLVELRALQGLLTDEAASRMAPLLDERAKVDGQLQRGLLQPAQIPGLIQDLERQERQVNRDFFWRDVEDALKPQP